MDLDPVILSRLQFAFVVSLPHHHPGLHDRPGGLAGDRPFYGAGLFALPVILIYTVAVYWIFHGKVRKIHDVLGRHW